MPTIVVADPSLVVLIGAAGVGKSSLASRHFKPDEILSSDAFRERIAGDAADQRVSAVAFRLLHRELEGRLADRRLTVVDATNAIAANRTQLVRRAAAAGIPVSAIVLHLPADLVRSRNAGRLRVVDLQVVERQLANVAVTLADDRLQREGFEQVVVLRTPEAVDRLTIIRRRTLEP